MIEILGQIILAGGDLAEVMSHIAGIEVKNLPSGAAGRTVLDHRGSTVVEIDPFFTNARLNAVRGLNICGATIGKHLTNAIIHEGRHAYQNFITTQDLGAPNEEPGAPDNDDDLDFLVDIVPIPASGSIVGITLDTSTSRTVCDPVTNVLSARSYSGDQVHDSVSEARLAIELDAYVFGDAHD